MSMHPNDRRDASPAERPATEKPSVVDLVTDPEKFDQWQRQREREEARGEGPADHPADHPDRRSDSGRSSGDPRDAPPGPGRPA